MESSNENLSVQLTEEERKYIYYLFSSKPKERTKEPGKIINLLFNKKRKSYLKSGS
jgi:hypothetical protein